MAIKPGGTSGGMNPLSWGTYCPGYAKMAGARKLPVQSADSRGAYWADKWCSTAYAFYGVEYRTEAAGELSRNDFIRRTFSDASCGATRLFTYNIDKHLTDSVASLHLFNGERGMTEIAMLAPTTTYFLNGDVRPAIALGDALRDDFDFDVLDELLIRDGVLAEREAGEGRRVGPYRILIAAGCRVIEADVLERLVQWVEQGGYLIWASYESVEDVAGKPFGWMSELGFEETVHLGRGMIRRIAPEENEVVAAVRDHSDSAGKPRKGFPPQ